MVETRVRSKPGDCWPIILMSPSLSLGRRRSRRRPSHPSQSSKERSATPRAISGPSSLRSTTTRRPAPPRATPSFLKRLVMARPRAAISCLTSLAARRCFPRMIYATAICAPIRGILRRCCGPYSKRAISSEPSTSRNTSISPRGALRPFARKHHRLPPLSRSLPDRRDYAGWRPRQDQRGNLRRMRPVRGGVSDRCGLVNRATCRRSVA